MGSIWVKVTGGFIEDESPGIQSCTEELGSDYERQTSFHSEPPKLYIDVYLPAFSANQNCGAELCFGGWGEIERSLCKTM